MKTVSYSEISVFNDCRQKHKWQYEMRLQPKTEALPLTVGSAGHVALQAYYLQQDWRKALGEWQDRQTVKMIESPTIQPENESEDDFYFTSTVTDLSEVTTLVTDVMERYILEYGSSDLVWKILEVEKRFEIPISDDTLLVGVWDLILEDQSGNIWIMDHKFPERGFRDAISLQLDAQVGIYQWAALHYGYRSLGFIYNELKRTVPKIPNENKTKNKYGGYMSLADCNTDWQTWAATAKMRGEEHLLPEYQLEMQPKLGTKEFFRRTRIFRTETEIENFVPQVTARLNDLKSGNVFMVPSRWGCENCDYKGLCLETLKGQDIQPIIDEDFTIRPKRDLVEEELAK